MGRPRSIPVVIGAVHGKWTVLSDDGHNSSGQRMIQVRCACGRVFRRDFWRIVMGRSHACYECAIVTHGLTRGGQQIPEYRIWAGMLQRCENMKEKSYSRYGARGIAVCDRWHSFEAFFADMGPRPSSKHSLDRYPNTLGNYEPGNCRWATILQQQQNMRNVRFRTLDDARISLSAIARYLAIPRETIKRRFKWASISCGE